MRNLEMVVQQPSTWFAIPETEPENTVFNHSAATRTVWDVARARMASPWGTLGAVIAQVAASIEPCVQIQPLIGGAGNLNIFIALVGGSGGGKGTCERATRHAVEVQKDGWSVQVSNQPLGSGEGVAEYYTPPRVTKKEETPPQAPTRGLFTAPEIKGLTATAARQGSTIIAVLNSAFSGEQLGATNASADTSRQVRADSYRFCLAVGVQPETSRPLLNEVGSGTPQRFVWLPVTDPTAPMISEDFDPSVVSPYVLNLGENIGTADHPYFMPVCETAKREIRGERHAVLRGELERDALDTHRLYVQLKVAAVLAIMAGRDRVTDDDWHVAAAIMSKSTQTRESMVQRLEEVDRQRNEQKARDRGRDQEITEQAREDQRIKRTRDNVLKHLRAYGVEVDVKALEQKLRSDLRRYVLPVLQQLEEDGHVHLTNRPTGEYDERGREIERLYVSAAD
ncbi:hypothetical protein [Corynebacterium urogenitale]